MPKANNTMLTAAAHSLHIRTLPDKLTPSRRTDY